MKRLFALMTVICLLAGCDKPLPTVTSIRIVPGSLDLNVGDSAPLSASIEPAEASNGAFNWSSDDSSIASVDQSGKVTALKEGTTTIKATLVDGSRSSSCKVVVTDPSVLKGISVEPGSITCGVTDVNQLEVKFTPETAANKKVTWKSSDESIAKVSSSGQVTAVAIGSATLTATSQEGGYTATCKVTVKASDVYYRAYSENFLNGTPYKSSNGTVTSFYSDGSDLYEYILPSDDSKTGVYKNGSLLAPVKTDDKIIMVKGNYIYFWWFGPLSIYDYSKKTWVFKKALSDNDDIRIIDVAAGPDGKTYVVGRVPDSSLVGRYASTMWTISSDMQTVTETRLHNGSEYDFTAFSVDVDSDGNVWVLSYRLGGLSNSGLKLYKNGVYVRSINYDNDANDVHHLIARGKDLYIFATGDSTYEVRVYKNNSVLYTIPGYACTQAGKPCFSKSGDIYIPVYDHNTRKSAIYKNGQLLYGNITESIEFLAVVH
ncbi:MAG: Ig domain-containing protein [Bacteroidales bacterium]|nr:Ig domain-containing protein [Bacteroidales bacterium]